MVFIKKMRNKQKKKETPRKKIVNVSWYSEALSSMDFCYKCDPSPCLWINDSDEEDEFYHEY